MSAPSRGVVPLQTESPGAAPPDAFGPFHVLHQAGAGTLGPVYRAFDPQRDRLVAVKVYRLGLPPDRMHQLVAAMERLIAVDLRHPTIVAPIAAGTDGIVVYVAQAFAAADSLDVVIRDRGPVPPAVALGITAHLAGALDFAAVVDVYHGALHPRDVLLSEHEVRLTGLGVARVLERLDAAAPVRRPYTAPERVVGARWDRRADIFSLAALTHEMLWGRRIAGPGEEAARSLTDLSGSDLPRLRATFARALAEEPADRFDTALDFVVALEAAFPGVAIAPAVPANDRSDEIALSEPGQKHQRLPFNGDTADSVTSRQSPVASLEATVSSLRSPVTSIDSSVRLQPDHSVSETPEASGSTAVFKVADTVRLRLDHPAFESVASQPSSADDRPSTVVGLPPSVDDRQPVDDLQPADSQSPPASEDQSPVSDDRLSLHVFAPSAPGVDMPLRDDAPVDPRARSVPKVSDDLWDKKISQPSLKWIERETAPVVDDEVPLFRSASGDGPASRPFWPIGLALIAGLVVGFSSGYLVGGRQRVTPATAAVSPTPDAQPASPRSLSGPGSTAKTASGPAKESTPPAPAPVKPETATIADARLLVRSVPAGATVIVDGVERGRTPMTVRNLAPGSHRLRIARDGYVTENQRVDVPRSRKPKSIRVTLQRTAAVPAGRAAGAATERSPETAEAARGEVEVQSRPAGAQVFLDGKLVGTTPVTTASTPVGEHQLRLERDGYRRWTSSIRVVGGQRTRVTASLER